MSNRDMVILFVPHLTAQDVKEILLKDFQGEIVVASENSLDYDIDIPYSLVSDDPEFISARELVSATYCSEYAEPHVPGTRICLATDWYFEEWTELFWDYFRNKTDYDFELSQDYADGLEVIRTRDSVTTLDKRAKTA